MRDAIVNISSLGGLGDGIADLGSKPVFVEKSAPGDHLKIRIINETKESLRGEIVEILKAGPDRVAPICGHYSACGGCNLQHLSNDFYQSYKKRVLASAFAHAGFPDTKAELIFLPTASRRRVELKFDGKKFAYYASRSRDLVIIEKCPILEPELQKLLSPISEALAKWHAARAIRTVSLTAADSGIDVIIECSSIVEDTRALEKMAEELNIARISMTAPDKKDRTVANRAAVTMRLGNYDIALSPGSFLQASKEGQRVLTDFVTNAAKDSKSIADLFAGIGTYSFALSQHVKRHAVESDIDMVKSLKAMSHLHGLNRNLSAEARDLFKNPLTTKELAGYDAIIINPPRPGAKSQVEILAHAKPTTIIMVSCNPASFARDARMLKDAGYKIIAAQGIDQFVMSPHLEIMAVFKR